jgi:superoxide oxidase
MTDPAGGANLEAVAESERFDDVSITLHWLTVLLIVALFASAWAREAVDHDTRLASTLMTVHRTTGVVTWMVGWLRLVWRYRFAYLPPFPESVPKLQQWAAKANEYGLYVLLLTQPISGIGNVLFRGHSFKLLVWEIPAVFDANPTIRDIFVEIHEFGGKALLTLIGLHACAALFHRLVLRDGVMERILPSNLPFAALSKKMELVPGNSLLKDPLFCFTSTTIEIHHCLDCRAPMTLTPDDLGKPIYHCFRCDHVDENSLLQRGVSN